MPMHPWLKSIKASENEVLQKFLAGTEVSKLQNFPELLDALVHSPSPESQLPGLLRDKNGRFLI